MIYFVVLLIAIGFAVSLPAIGSAFAQGKAVTAAMESIARQPEASGPIQTAMIIGLAFIEALTIFAFVIALILIGRVPETAVMLDLIQKLGK